MLENVPDLLRKDVKKMQSHQPIGSMYAICGNIYHQYTPNVSIYTSTMDPMGIHELEKTSGMLPVWKNETLQPTLSWSQTLVEKVMTCQRGV